MRPLGPNPASSMGPLRQIELLRAVLDITSSDLDVHVVVQRVAELLTGVAGSDVCFVHLVDEERGTLVLVGATPPFDELAGTIELRLGEGVAGWVALHGRPAVVPDKWSDPRYRYLPALRGEDYTSLVSVPMIRRGTRVVGALNLHARQPRQYDEVDVALLGDLANLVAGTVDNARLYQRLMQREETLARFAARTIEAQELERRRLAGDIHDGISQRLVSLAYHLDAASSVAGAVCESVAAAGSSHVASSPRAPAKRRTAPAPLGPRREGLDDGEELTDGAQVLAAELAAARRLVDDALDEARSAIRGLRPSVLDDLGLAAGLRGLARELPDIDVDVDVDVDVESIALPAHVETALYRVGQEALQNVVKHAGASHVRLVLQRQDDRVVLVVEDDGRGFETKTSHNPGSYGLEGMAERIDMVGGHLSLRSSPGQGTVITATVPATAPTGTSPSGSGATAGLA